MSTLARSLAVLVLASFVSVGINPPSFAEEEEPPLDPLRVENGGNYYVDQCEGADFTVTIGGTEYSPGDVASGFSLGSSLSFDTTNELLYVPYAVVQDGYGWGAAYDPTSWTPDDYIQMVDQLSFDDFSLDEGIMYASVFVSACEEEDKYAYIQVFPGLTLQEVNVPVVEVEEGYELDVSAIDESFFPFFGELIFTPLSNFQNSVYAFWAHFLQIDFIYGNDYSSNQIDSVIGYGDPLARDFEQAIWGFLFGETDELPLEFASGYYIYTAGSGLAESSIDDVLEVDTPSTPSASVSGDPGIFLTVTGGAGSLFEGRTVIYGSYAVAPNSPYKLTVQSISNPWRETRVLASGVVNGGGHLEATTLLPRMAADSYRIVFEGVAVNGQPLKLTNHVNVNAAGRFTSISAERLQPLLR